MYQALLVVGVIFAIFGFAWWQRGRLSNALESLRKAEEAQEAAEAKSEFTERAAKSKEDAASLIAEARRAEPNAARISWLLSGKHPRPIPPPDNGDDS
jgi:hypothetical protein